MDRRLSRSVAPWASKVKPVDQMGLQCQAPTDPIGVLILFAAESTSSIATSATKAASAFSQAISIELRSSLDMT